MNEIEAMLERIKRDAGLTDPDQIELVARTATTATALAARASLGENVEEELEKVKAITLNLEENVRRVAGLQISLYLQSFVAGVLGKLLLR